MLKSAYNPLVSVIIPLYNCEEFAAEAIESVLAQTYQNFEIIVINDGSTDRSADAVKRYLDRIVYREQKNSGSAVARNEGIKLAKGELIAFLDADDLWLPDRLESQVPHFETHPETGLAHADRILFDSETNEEFPDDNDAALKAKTGNILPELFQYNFIATQTVMIRRECFEDVGLFDPEFRAAQDYNMWLRICKKYAVHYMPKVVARYRIHEGQISWRFDVSYESERRVIEKFIEQNPGMEFLKTFSVEARLADLYYRFGHDCFHSRNFEKARETLSKSLNYKWANPRAALFLMLSVAGPSFIRQWDRIWGTRVGVRH